MGENFKGKQRGILVMEAISTSWLRMVRVQSIISITPGLFWGLEYGFERKARRFNLCQHTA